MSRSDQIIQMIECSKPATAPVTAASHLMIDLGYDSLAFVRLLLEIEEAISIRFELMEMEECLRAGRLISLVEQKIQQSEAAHD